MPGRRLMLTYYAVSVVIGLLTLAVDPGAAFGGRGLMLWIYGLGYALAGAYGVLTRSLGRASSERVAVATLAALSWVHGVAPSQGAWVAGMRLVNAILFTAVWLVMFSTLMRTSIPRGDITLWTGSPPPGRRQQSQPRSLPASSSGGRRTETGASPPST